MRNPLCLLGSHDWRDWTAHTNGPCVFVSDVHIFRYCKRKNCTKGQHDFATIQNGTPQYRLDGGIPKRDLRAEATAERREFDV